MKRVGFLYEKFFTNENIELAIKNATKNKKDRRVVRKVLNRKEEIINFIQANPYYKKTKPKIPRYDKSSGKIRDTVEPDIVYLIKQHAVVQVILPIISRDFYYHSYGAIKGKGITKASQYLRVKLKKGCRHVAHLDGVKYYDNIVVLILMNLLKRKIKDKKALDLIFDMLGDEETIGILLGNYMSQPFANVYLTPLDNFVLTTLKPKLYIRQMDDIVIGDDNKRKLKKCIQALIEFFSEELKGKFHEEKIKIIDLTKTKIRNGKVIFKNFIDFCGYKHYLGGKVEIRKRTFKKIRQTIFALTKALYLKLARRFMSYWGKVIHSNNHQFLKKYMPLINMANLRQCISKAN